MTNRNRVRHSSRDISVEPRIMLCGASLDGGGQSFANQSAPAAAPSAAAASPTSTQANGCGLDQVATQNAAPAQGLSADGCDTNAVAPANTQVPVDADPCAAAGGVSQQAAVAANGGSAATGQVAGMQQVGNQSQPTRAEVQAISQTNQATQGSSLAANSSSSSSASASQTATDITPPQPSTGVGTRPFGQTASSLS